MTNNLFSGFVKNKNTKKDSSMDFPTKAFDSGIEYYKEHTIRDMKGTHIDEEDNVWFMEIPNQRGFIELTKSDGTKQIYPTSITARQLSNGDVEKRRVIMVKGFSIVSNWNKQPIQPIEIEKAQ